MKKAVKFFFALTLLIYSVIFIAGCAKDEDPGEYYIRFKANGTSVEYTNQLGLTAGFGQSGNQYVGTVSGWNDASSNLTLILYSKTLIIESTYSGYSVSVDGIDGVLIAYKDKVSGENFGSGVASDFEARVTITEISDTGVKGAFNGTVKAAGRNDISITEGLFFVKRVYN